MYATTRSAVERTLLNRPVGSLAFVGVRLTGRELLRKCAEGFGVDASAGGAGDRAVIVVCMDESSFCSVQPPSHLPNSLIAPHPMHVGTVSRSGGRTPQL
jgi:hypothetical protein